MFLISILSTCNNIILVERKYPIPAGTWERRTQMIPCSVTKEKNRSSWSRTYGNIQIISGFNCPWMLIFNYIPDGG